MALASVDTHELESCRGWAKRLFDGALDAICVRGLYDVSTCGDVVGRLARQPRDAREHADPGRAGVEVVGVPVSPSTLFPDGPDIETYRDGAGAFEALCMELFAPAAAFHERVLAALAVVFDAPVHVPAGYGVATFRRVPPGCGMDPHHEDLYAHIAVYDALRERADLARVLSVFLVLQAPTSGGALRLRDVDVAIPPETGTLVVFAGGRREHEVTAVGGERARWTVGGFAAPAHDGGALYWA